MPDISMCNAGKGLLVCPRRAWCYRYTAKPNEYRQAYFTEAPFEVDHPNVCTFYIKAKSESQVKRLGSQT